MLRQIVLQKQTAMTAIGILLAILALSIFTAEITIILPGLTPDEEWNKTYTLQDSLYNPRSVRQTSNGGYILAGEIEWVNYTSGMWLVKTDPNGNMQWNSTFVETNQSCWAVYAEQISDGGYMVIGGSLGGIIILKTDQNGVQQWNASYRIGGKGFVTCAERTSDGGYVTTGPGLLVKLDSAGNMQWNRTLTEGWILCVRQASDGGYILAGTAGSRLYADPVLVKTNQSGGIQWNNTYSGLDHPSAESVQPTPDGGYMIVGQEGWHGLLIKVDANGTALWSKTYQGEYWSELNSIQNTSDGGYVMTGVAYSTSHDDAHFWLVRTDSNANLEWKKTLSQRCDIHYESSIQQTSDGDYVITGTTYGYIEDHFTDFWIGKVAGQNSPDKWATVIGLSATVALTAVASIVLIDRGYAHTKIKNPIATTDERENGDSGDKHVET